MGRCGTVVLALARGPAAAELAALAGAGIDAACLPPDALGGAEPEAIVTELAASGGLPPAVAEALGRDPALEVLVLAPAARAAEALRTLRTGAVDVLLDPCPAGELVEAVRRALERRRARRAAEDAPRRLRWGELGRVAAGLAHELANPLAILQSALGSVDDALAVLHAAALPPDGTSRQAVEQAAEAAGEALVGMRRIRTLARDLRTLMRGDPAALAPTDLREAIEMALRVGRVEIAAHAQVSVEVPPGVGAEANLGVLAEAVLHLVRAAVEASQAAGLSRSSLALRARQEQGACVLELVTEIPPLPRDPALAHLEAHVPAGLPTAAGAHAVAAGAALVASLGGEVRAVSGPDGGTILRVALRPVEAAAAGVHEE
jgi:signal transduction histidine kinase